MKTKFPKPLMDQMQVMQEEIEQRKQEAERDTLAAYNLIIHLLVVAPEHEISYKEDQEYREAFIRIQSRRDELLAKFNDESEEE